ncbi:MAG: SWIB/MDM2 domain-containing protein [Minisyncoccia bacterium]
MAKSNSAFMKPMNISPELAAVVGKGPMPRSEVVKKLWMYIKGDAYEDENGKKGNSLRQGSSLQDPKNKRNINADANLKKVFGGKEVVNMFEMTKLISKHLS